MGNENLAKRAVTFAIEIPSKIQIWQIASLANYTRDPRKNAANWSDRLRMAA